MPRSSLLNTIQQRLRRPFGGNRGRAVERVFIDGTKELFSARSGPDGNPWPPLDPETREDKRGPQPNIETGRLYESLVNSGHPDHIYIARGDMLRIGSSVPYAAYVNEARPYLYNKARAIAAAYAQALVERR